MKAIVAYESMFGNTEAIARSVAEGLARRLSVELVEVGRAAPEGGRVEGIDLLVVGGPTHVWGVSHHVTREEVRRQLEDDGFAPASRGVGVREWLRGLSAVHRVRRRPLAAAFDTALRTTGWFPHGSAARREAMFLIDKGYRLLSEPEQFLVVGIEGPLEDGEIQRARAWGADLASGVLICRPPT